MNIDTGKIKDANELTAEEKSSGKWRPLSRAERRALRNEERRKARKTRSRALHGLPVMHSAPSLLQSLRMGAEIQSRRGQIDALMGLPAEAQ